MDIEFVYKRGFIDIYIEFLQSEEISFVHQYFITSIHSLCSTVKFLLDFFLDSSIFYDIEKAFIMLTSITGHIMPALCWSIQCMPDFVTYKQIVNLSFHLFHDRKNQSSRFRIKSCCRNLSMPYRNIFGRHQFRKDRFLLSKLSHRLFFDWSLIVYIYYMIFLRENQELCSSMISGSYMDLFDIIRFFLLTYCLLEAFLRGFGSSGISSGVYCMSKYSSCFAMRYINLL